ncbi:DUF2089 family protein [Neobacillus niacini]|uniref:DUF2089 family protein n=1 Tax=Neobacillus niacini TaxID=86668 RepID=UPI001C8E07EB|nr:DUF2089 family protein [Neobacillus niacini]MBY0147750.1 DUF2089 family protein [Neobacillus niacini]
MEKELVSHCPRCSNNLIATHLICKECDLELSGNFGLSKFDYLSTEELDFVISFLRYHGNFKAIQGEKGMSYPAVKKKITEIVKKLGIEDINHSKTTITSKAFLSFLQIEHTDSPVIAQIKEKLNACGGKATIKLLQGDDCEIWYDANGKGLVSPKIPPANQLCWQAFDAAVQLVIQNGGKAAKGKARSGAKLGSNDLPIDSVEGYIAHKVHGVQEGETAFGPGFVIAAVLDWANICNNIRGFLSIKPTFLEDYKDKL